MTQICRYIAKFQSNCMNNCKKVPSFRWKLANVQKLHDTCLYVRATHRHWFVPRGRNPHTLYHNFGITQQLGYLVNRSMRVTYSRIVSIAINTNQFTTRVLIFILSRELIFYLQKVLYITKKNYVGNKQSEFTVKSVKACLELIEKTKYNKIKRGRVVV